MFTLALLAIERVRARVSPHTHATLLAAAALTVLVVTTAASWPYESHRQLALSISATVCAFVVASAVTAATTRRNRRTYRAAALLLLAGGLALLAFSYHGGRTFAANMDHSPAGGYSFAGQSLLPRKHFIMVRARNVEGVPEQCGLLLGAANGSYLMHYDSPRKIPFPGHPGVRTIWRLPIDAATLENC